MRKETSNQFTEGLVSDLNPINTPNTVLTDALNATIITYNGNEHSLQNDMGNYELKHCKLSPNYIPVGIKEYGDILYIVSQNPLDGSVEIGSYPSPLMINESENYNEDCEIKSIIKDQILDKNLKEGWYNTLMKNVKGFVFNDEKFKLNPGDEYCLQTDGKEPPYKYETIEYHILDEESNPHNVTDKIKLGDKFNNIAWTTPGWLSIKPRLAELSTAGINVKSFYVPKDAAKKSAFFSFDFRLNVNDKYLIDEGYLSKWCEEINDKTLWDVRFRIYIEKEVNGKYISIYNKPFVEIGIVDETPSDNFYCGNFGWEEWFGDNRILWKNVFGRIDNVDNINTIRVKMIPVLGEKEHGYKIIYDNLKQELSFDLNKIYDDGWAIGSELYQFYVSADGKSQYIYTNVDGPKISSFPVNLEYEIFDLDQNLIKNGTFNDYSGIGENLFQIPFDDSFKKENIYIIKFNFKKDRVDSETLLPSISRILITSEVFNKFSNNLLYDKEVSFNDWVNCYLETYNVSVDMSFNQKNLESEIYDSHSEFTESDKRYMSNKKYNTFFSSENSGLSEQLIFRKGFTDEFAVKNKPTITKLEGDIWNAFEPITNFAYKTGGSTEFKPLTGTISINQFVETTLELNSENKFLFADLNEMNFIDGLREYIGDELSDEQIKNLGFDLGKITDYRVEIRIYVSGGGADQLSGDWWDEDRKRAACSVRLMKNDKPLDINNPWYRKGLEEIKQMLTDILYNKRWNFWIDENEGLIWRVGDAGIIEPCMLPKLFISWVLRELKLPFLWVSTNYFLSRESSNWRINTGVVGGEWIPDFCFNLTDNAHVVHDYVAFHRRLSEFQCEGKSFYENAENAPNFVDYNKLENWNPVLVPLTSRQMGTTYFKNMCEGLTFIKKNKALEDTSVYLFTKKSEKEVGSNIDVYYKTTFKNKSGLIDTNYRQSIIDKLRKFGIENVSVLNGDFVENEYKPVYSETLKEPSFKTNAWPYISIEKHDGVSDLNRNISTWMSGYNTDVAEWLNSDKYKILQDGDSNLIGVYTKYESNKTHLRDMLTEGYQKTGKLSLYGQVFNIDSSDTKTMLTQISSGVWSYLYDIPANIAPYEHLPKIPGIIIRDTNDAFIGSGTTRGDNMSIRLTLGNCVSLSTWTNSTTFANYEAKVTYIHGTVWKDYPQWRLDSDWDWIQG